MDLTYGPGELDHKVPQKREGSDMKRDHDSVDDFEHLEPEISPVSFPGKDFTPLEKLNSNQEERIEKAVNDGKDNVIDPLSVGPSNDQKLTTGTTDTEFSARNTFSSNKDFLEEFEADQIKTDVDLETQSDRILGQSNLLDVGMGGDISAKTLPHQLEESNFSADFILSERETQPKRPEIDSKTDLSSVNPTNDTLKDTLGMASYNQLVSNPDEEFGINTKSLKEAEALSQYNMKFDKHENDGNKKNGHSEHDLEPEAFNNGKYDADSFNIDLKNYIAICPAKPSNELEFENELEEPKSKLSEPNEESQAPFLPKETHTKNEKKNKDEAFNESFIIKNEEEKTVANTDNSNPTLVSTEDIGKTLKKTSVPDLDDIIGPEDVFKRIGLDAWFTPERLHPTVEALVYWRDPKQSGVVFGAIMAILLSLCYMSLISVVAYSSLLALSGAICFRIYKNILQAVQKTSEGHPFKEYLDLDLSLPQDKVRESVDTAVVHINAAIVELRRLFLVEDLIDSIKFAVCLWCLTYVGAIFNGMTLVILAFVALFTVPKIYENNKASIDQYIELGRSKVAEITSKVKAALPVGKKEPEKDKEQ